MIIILVLGISLIIIPWGGSVDGDWGWLFKYFGWPGYPRPKCLKNLATCLLLSVYNIIHQVQPLFSYFFNIAVVENFIFGFIEI